MEGAEKKSFYRDPEVRAEIERVTRDVFWSEEIPDSILERMFGLKGVELTHKERKDFELYVHFAGKRLGNAVLHAPGKVFESKSEAIDFFLDFNGNLGQLPFHDIAHTIVNYEDSHDGNSIVPQFLKNEKRYNNPAIIEEEARALMWDSIISDLPIFITFLDEQARKKMIAQAQKDLLKGARISDPSFKKRVSTLIDAFANVDPNSFESVFQSYLTAVYEIIRYENNKEATESGAANELSTINAEYDRIIAELKSHPDPKLVAMAKTVFDNYKNDPKILFHEFQRICGPLIDKLKKRK